MRIPELEKMSFAELKAWVADRLQERGAAGSSIDRRMDEPAYSVLLHRWQSGEDAFRERLERVCVALIAEVARKPWAADHAHNLGALIEEAEMFRAAEELKSVVRAHTWLRDPDGLRRHMIALRTLLGLGCKEDPNFLLDEHNTVLNRRFPELVFRGLLAHGMRPAFSRLGEIVSDAVETRRVLALFPSILDKNGLEELAAAVAEARPRLTREVASEIGTWARRRGYDEIIEALGEPQARKQMPSIAHLRALGRTSVTRPDAGWSDELPSYSYPIMSYKPVTEYGKLRTPDVGRGLSTEFLLSAQPARGEKLAVFGLRPPPAKHKMRLHFRFHRQLFWGCMSGGLKLESFLELLSKYSSYSSRRYLRNNFVRLFFEASYTSGSKNWDWNF